MSRQSSTNTPTIQIGILVALVMVTSLAGRSTVPHGEEAEVIYIGSINASNSDFQMDGHLSTGGGVPDPETYRNIKIQLYAENGTMLCSVKVGDLRANHGRRNVSVTSTVVPEYVLVTSPDFWNEQTKVNYFQRSSSGEEYERERVFSKSELPVSIVESNKPSCAN